MKLDPLLFARWITDMKIINEKSGICLTLGKERHFEETQKPQKKNWHFCLYMLKFLCSMSLQAKRNNTKEYGKKCLPHMLISLIFQSSPRGGFLRSLATMYSDWTALVPIFNRWGTKNQSKGSLGSLSFLAVHLADVVQTSSLFYLLAYNCQSPFSLSI